MKNNLKDLKGENKLKDYVIDWLLDNMENYSGNNKEQLTALFNDLARGGCGSGMVSELIYYKDTHIFYDEYYNEIEELREEYELENGESLKIKGDLKNWLAWFGFEQTAWNIQNELGFE